MKKGEMPEISAGVIWGGRAGLSGDRSLNRWITRSPDSLWDQRTQLIRANRSDARLPQLPVERRDIPRSHGIGPRLERCPLPLQFRPQVPRRLGHPGKIAFT